jgi:hypothetical protein
MKSLTFKLITLALAFSVGIVAAIAFRGNSRIVSSSQISHRTQQNEIEDEEYAVYSALINDSTEDENVNRLLVIMDQPSAWTGFMEEERDSFYENILKSSPTLMAETVNDLKAKNNEHHRFTRRFNIKRRYLLVSGKVIDDLFSKNGVGGGWEKFYQKYPETRGYATFSRVGFNADKTQALVYQAHSCGGLCGGGTYRLLIKTNGVWTIKGSVGPTWVS